MFTIRNFETKTLSWWHNQKEKLDFNPPYQRKGKLWSTKDKTFLIDSILNGFDLPKIYIADFTFVESKLNKSKKPYAIIDGKQRFEAIFDFFEGKIALDPDFNYYKNKNINIGGMSYQDLKTNYPEIASEFENYNLSVISIITDEDSKINELFVRLNKSKALTGAELRNAMEGIVPNLIREITEHGFFREKIKFTTNRGQDNNTAAKLLLTEFRGKLVDTKKVQLDRFVNEAVDAESDNFESAALKVKSILDNMYTSFLDKDNLLKSSGLIPVYYMLFKEFSNSTTLRTFLYTFDIERKKAIKLSKEGSTVDVDYLKFENFTKSMNDQGSLKGCYDILEKKLKENLNSNR